MSAAVKERTKKSDDGGSSRKSRSISYERFNNTNSIISIISDAFRMKDNEAAQQAKVSTSKEVNKVMVFYTGGMLLRQKDEDFVAAFKRFESIVMSDTNLVDPSSTHFYQMEKPANQGWLVSPISNKIHQRVESAH